MRALTIMVGLVALATTGCETHACKAGTLLISVSLSSGVVGATTLAIDVAVQGGGERRGTISIAGKRSGTVEVDFSRYPSGKTITITATAFAGATALGTQSRSTTLGASCGNLSLVIDTGGVAASDGGLDAADAAPATDLAGAGASDGAFATDLATVDACVPHTSCAGVTCGTLADGCGASLDCGSCQLLSATPTIAQSGATIALEGTFASSVTVNFPGGVSAPASVLGPHRATVIVPATATTGPLSVTTGGGTVGALPFRTASFVPSLGGFNSRYEQTEYARVYPYLHIGRGFFSTISTGSLIYVIGGDDNGGGSVNYVEHAGINADGTLTPFIIDTIALNTKRSSASSVVIGNTAYVIGGYNSVTGKLLGSIEQSTIAADGSLSAFTIASVTLATARKAHASVIAGNTLYVIGGIDQSGNAVSTIETATIKPDGSLTAFAADAGASLISPRSSATAIVSGGWLYVVGGASVNALASVERAAIRPDGSLSPFSLVPSVNLIAARSTQASLVVGNTLYVIDGQASDGSQMTSIEQATIAADGSLTTFSTSPSSTLYPGRVGTSAVVVGNWAYVIGGDSINFGVDNSIERASIDGGGSLSSFSLDATQMATSRHSFCTVVLGNQLYLIGGSGPNGNNVTSIESSTIGPDGKLAPFVLSTATIKTGRANHSCVVANGAVYVIGGYNSSGDHPVGSVEMAPINADGTLGTFSTTTVTLAVPRYGHSSFVAGINLYVIGGFNNNPPNAGYYGSIEKATLDVSGTLGTFSLSSVSLATPRSGHVNFILDDTLYVVAGRGDTAPTIEQTTILSDNTFGAFSASTSVLASGRASFGTLLLGSQLYLIGGSDASMEQAVFGTNSLGSFATSASMLGQSRSPHTYAFGNHAYAVGGFNDTIESSILP